MNSASRCISESVSRLHPSELRLTSPLTVCGCVWEEGCGGIGKRDVCVGGGVWRYWEEGCVCGRRGVEVLERGVCVCVGGGAWRYWKEGCVCVWEEGRGDIGKRGMCVWEEGCGGIGKRGMCVWEEGRGGIGKRGMCVWEEGCGGIGKRGMCVWEEGCGGIGKRGMCVWEEGCGGKGGRQRQQSTFAQP